ncbi:MAG: polysaccharide biosynthesis/export family protein [Pseudolabrys sp.]
MALTVALAAASCARQPRYALEPASGQAMAQSSERGLSGSGLFSRSPYAAQQSYAQQAYAPQAYQPQVPPSAPSGGGLFASRLVSLRLSHLFEHRPSAPQQAYAQQTAPPAQAQADDRGLFNSRRTAPQAYAYVSPQMQASAVIQYSAPQYAAAPYAYAAVSPYQQAYALDSGDKLRIVVFGQDGISNTYLVDAGGNVSLPLIGTVPARGATSQQLSQRIAERLRQGYVREPHVTVEVETYRPFFILGEVTTPGQYPYVADMTVEKAIAIAGGFAPRAAKSTVEITRNAPGQPFKAQVPLSYPIRPGDTVLVKERWF